MFYQALLSSEVNRSAIINHKHRTLEVPDRFPIDFRLMVWGN